MDATVFFNTLWPLISTGLIVPVTQWLKSKMPGDWPVQATLISAVLNFLTIILLNMALSMGLTLEAMIPYITAGFALSTAGHAGLKSMKKNFIKAGGA